VDHTLRLLDRVLAAYRESDWDECIRRVRPLVDAEPQAIGPRELLASLYLVTGTSRLALIHYEKLFTLVICKGELYHAVAIQKRLDGLRPNDSLAPGRFAAIQRWMRTHGLSFDGSAVGSGAHPLIAPVALALPHEAFETLGEVATLESFRLEPRVLDADAATVLEVVWGRLRWSLELPDGRRTAEIVSTESETIVPDTERAGTSQTQRTPELPSECLRLPGEVIQSLRRVLAERGHRSGFGGDDLTHERRALLPTRPRRAEDLDFMNLSEEAAMSDASASAAPPRLELGVLANENAGDNPRDVGPESVMPH
jgi:hypothetical protein